MPGREYSTGNAYRYRFNGKERDKETAAISTYDYGFRIYNAALSRFLSIDPLTPKYPELTPFQFASNSPVANIELDGLERFYYSKSFDSKGNVILTLIRTEEIIEKHTERVLTNRMVGGRSADTDPQPVYENREVTVVNPRKEYVISRKSERPVERFNKITYVPVDEEAVYTSCEDMSKGSDADFHIIKSDFWLVYISKGLNNVAEEMENGHIPGANKSASSPGIKGQINSRHELNSNSIAKAGKTQSVTLAPKSILEADLAAYNSGAFSKGKNGNVIINGNTYGVKNEGKTLYPINGKNFVSLSAGQVQAIQFYKTKIGDDLTKALDGAKVSQTDRTFAQEFISKY